MPKVDQETNWRCYSCSRLGVNYVTLGIGELLLLILTVCSLAAIFPRVRKTKLVSMVVKMGKCLYLTLCSFIYKTASVAHVHIEKRHCYIRTVIFHFHSIKLSEKLFSKGILIENVICDTKLMGSYELYRNITCSKTLFLYDDTDVCLSQMFSKRLVAFSMWIDRTRWARNTWAMAAIFVLTMAVIADMVRLQGANVIVIILFVKLQNEPCVFG